MTQEQADLQLPDLYVSAKAEHSFPSPQLSTQLKVKTLLTRNKQH